MGIHIAVTRVVEGAGEGPGNMEAVLFPGPDGSGVLATTRLYCMAR